MDPSPRTNEVLKPMAFQTLLTYTFILGESPIRLQPLFLILHCLRLQSSQLPEVFFSDLALGTSRELLSGRVMQDSLCIFTPSGRAMQDSLCILLPLGLVWVCRHTLLPSVIPHGDSLLQRHNTAPLA